MKKLQKSVTRTDALLIAGSLIIAMAVAALWLYFAGLQTGRKPGSDAVFVRRVQQYVQKG